MKYSKNKDAVLVRILHLLEATNESMTKAEIRGALCYNKPFYQPNTVTKGLLSSNYLKLISIKSNIVEIQPAGRDFLVSIKEERCENKN